MRLFERGIAYLYAGAAPLCATLLLSAGMAAGAAAADDKTYVMKITLATQNDNLHQFARNYSAALERDSTGRLKVEIYPGSQLGSISRQIEGIQFGAIQAAVLPPEFYAGVDERFEVLGSPGLVTTMEQGQRLTADPAVRSLMLNLGSGKGLHGVALFMAAPSSVASRTPIRHLGDFKGKKIRILASQFQSVAMRRLGATPKPMTLAEVIPALQDNALDGALGAITVFTAMNYQAAAKYVTEIGQPAIFAIVEISKKWYDSLPADLQQIVDHDAAVESAAINPHAIAFIDRARKAWVEAGGELISLPADEQSTMLKILVSVGDEVANAKPELSAAYKIVTDAAQRAQ